MIFWLFVVVFSRGALLVLLLMLGLFIRIRFVSPLRAYFPPSLSPHPSLSVFQCVLLRVAVAHFYLLTDICWQGFVSFR